MSEQPLLRQREPKDSPQIPEFQITRLQAPRGWAQVTCKRTACKRTFHIHLASWLKSSPDVITRACPYCFKVGRIPRDMRKRGRS